MSSGKQILNDLSTPLKVDIPALQNQVLVLNRLNYHVHLFEIISFQIIHTSTPHIYTHIYCIILYLLFYHLSSCTLL